MKKILITEVGGENCPCRIYEVLHSAIIGYTCGRDKEVCDKERCSNCPHGKTLSEMAETANKEILNEMTGGKADSAPSHLSFTKRLYTGLNALLGGEVGK